MTDKSSNGQNNENNNFPLNYFNSHYSHSVISYFIKNQGIKEPHKN